MSIPFNSSFYYLFTDNPHNSRKLNHIHFHYYTLYYTTHNNQYIPIILSKPHSTQLPYYYTLPLQLFPSLQSLINHILSNPPLK